MLGLVATAYKYHDEHHEFPKSLDLLVGKPEALLDPWGRAYHYDLKGPHNHGEQPDIWSEGADPKDPHAVLGNWDDGSN